MSVDLRRKTCPVVDGRVEAVSIHRKIGFRDCDLGVSWGFDDFEIWVDSGCKAEFKVTYKGNCVFVHLITI